MRLLIFFSIFQLCHSLAHQGWSDFHTKVSSLVKNHPVVCSNQYTIKFAEGHATYHKQQDFVQQFSVFSQWFLVAQLTKVLNAPTIEEMREGKEILCNELGVIFSEEGTIDKGVYKHNAAHYEWLLEFGERLELNYDDMGSRKYGNPNTLLFCDELLRLYGSSDDVTSIAASYAIENWATSGFWDDITLGFEKINDKRRAYNIKPLPLKFWKLHAKLEAQHAQHTYDELKNVYMSGRITDEDAFLYVCENMLDAVDLFWKGLKDCNYNDNDMTTSSNPTTNSNTMKHFITSKDSTFKGKDRDFKSIGASSVPDWISISPDNNGEMDHFISTAGAFKGKERDFTSIEYSTDPNWISDSTDTRSEMDHFTTENEFKGKDRDFRSIDYSSDPNWISDSTSTRGIMDHFSSTAGKFKGKDRNFKSMGTSSNPNWLSSSSAYWSLLNPFSSKVKAY